MSFSPDHWDIKELDVSLTYGLVSRGWKRLCYEEGRGQNFI